MRKTFIMKIISLSSESCLVFWSCLVFCISNKPRFLYIFVFVNRWVISVNLTWQIIIIIYISLFVHEVHILNINIHTIIQSIKTKEARRSFSAYNI